MQIFNPMRYIRASHYAIVGLKSAWRTQPAFRVEIIALFVLIPIACWFGGNLLQRLLLISALLLIVIVELLNSAIETLVDRIGFEKNELSGRAKDIAAGAVLVAIINAIIIWLCILF